MSDAANDRLNDLQARLQAAGVTDAASLQAALESDPQLKHDLEAYQAEQLSELLAEFASVGSSDELIALVQQNSFLLSDEFTELIEQQIGAAEAAGDEDVAAIFRERLATLQQIKDHLEAQPEQLAKLLDQFAEVSSSDELVALAQREPTLLSDEFVMLVAQQINAAEAAGDENAAEGFRQRLAGLQQIIAHLEAQSEQLSALLTEFASVGSSVELEVLAQQEPVLLSEEFAALVEQQISEAEVAGDENAAEGFRQRLVGLQHFKEQAEVSPLVQALQAFLGADDEVSARQVFEEHRAILLPYEVFQMLGRFQGGTLEAQQRIEERRALLQLLRGGQQIRSALPLHARPTFNNTGMNAQQVTQVAGSQYNQSAHAERGGSATVINEYNLNDVQWQRHWTPPRPPRIPRPPVSRADDVRDVVEKLRESGRTAITSNSVTVQGMAGVGKTFLAHLLASDQRMHYSGGILWEEIGNTRLSPADQNRILNRWAAYAFDVQQKQDYQFEPGAVRVLLSTHSSMLVVFDDVWNLEDVEPLIEALPADADILITTRSQRVADDLGGDVHNLDVLAENEARDLIALRVRSKCKLTEADYPWMDALAQSVGRHTLALDIAIGSLKRRQAYEWPEAAQQIARDIREGTGFGELLLLEGEERRAEVEISLKLSYDTLPQLAQDRFRTLGAFAPEATFSTAAVASMWECAETDARNLLNFLTEAALLTPAEERDTWRQHSILRAYSLALLHLLDEYDATAARHAKTYDELMREAHNAQRYYELLPAYPQLRHAFPWSLENDLQRALNLITNTRNLQTAFGFVREALEWCEGVVNASRRRGDPGDIARALGSIGNILVSVAELPGEDRKTRLGEALAAYEAALEYYRSETTPLEYATAQNNRGNVLGLLAMVREEDRSARLGEALAAYEAALVYRRPETAPLDYAMTQNNRGSTLQALATMDGEDSSARLQEALAAYGAALEHYRPETTPLNYATTQSNRGNVLQNLATVSGEDRGARLREALVAYEAALVYRRPETVPLEYAATQSHRGDVLQNLAMVSGEDQGARLGEALAAYEAALVYRRPETVPLEYAATQNNRGAVLLKLATVFGEDRKTRLGEALAACEAALVYHRPEMVPLGYAATQNNRGNVLLELATVPGEDRETWLREALAAYEAALVYRRPETAPLEYALTQNNRGNVLLALATLPEEDRGARLREALNCAWEAVSWFERFEHHYYFHIAQEVLRRIRLACGDDFEEFWQLLGVGSYPAWLSREAVQDLAREEQLIKPLFAVLNSRSLEEMQQLVESYPLLHTEAVDPIFVQLREQYADEEARIAHLTGMQALLQSCREREVTEVFAEVAQAQNLALQFQQAFDRYLELKRVAMEAEQDLEAWQIAVDASTALLNPVFADLPTVNRPALHADIASVYNALGNALDDAKDKPGALAAFERAVDLQPDFAMWRRNRAGMLIELGQLEEAVQEIVRARELEPDAERLPQLESELTAARQAKEQADG